MKKLFWLLVLLPSFAIGSGIYNPGSGGGGGATVSVPPYAVLYSTTGTNIVGSSSFTYTGSSLAVTGVSSTTYTGVSTIYLTSATFDVTLSSMVMGPTNLNGSYGTVGQVFTSAGQGSTPTWTTVTGSTIGLVLQSSQSINSSVTSTSGSSFSVTKSSVTLTPKYVNSMFLIAVTGNLCIDGNANYNAEGTIMRKIGTGAYTDLSNSGTGSTTIQAPYVASMGVRIASAGMYFKDLPNTTSQITYAAGVASSDGSHNAYWNCNSNDTYVTVTEISQ